MIDAPDLAAKTAKKVKKLKPNTQLAIGFDISSRQDLQKILKIADIAIVGSAVIREIKKYDVSGGIKIITKLF